MKQLIFLSFSLLIPNMNCYASAVKEVPGQPEVPYKPLYDDYIDEVFKFDSRWHQLPKDIQYYILSFLPHPIKAIRPKNYRVVIDEELRWAHSPTFTLSGEELIIIKAKSFFLLALDGSYRSEDIPLEVIRGEIDCYAFNSDHTQLAYGDDKNVHIATLDNYRVVDTVIISPPERLIKRFFHKIRYTQDGNLILANSLKQVVLCNVTTNQIEELSPYDPTQKRKSYDTHPKGTHVIFGDETCLELFDVEKREWKVIEDIKLPQNKKHKDLLLQYNSDGSQLLIGSYYEAFDGYQEGGGYEEDGDKRLIALRLVSLWDMESEKPKKVGNSFIGGHSDIEYLSNDSYIVSYGHETFDQWHLLTGRAEEVDLAHLGVYSVATQERLLCLEGPLTSFLCTLDPTGQFLITKHPNAQGRATGIRIYDLSPSWQSLDVIKKPPRTFKQYFLLQYLHFLGRYGLTITSEGLAPIDKYSDRFTLVEGGPNQEQVEQIKKRYEEFEKPAKDHIDWKYGTRFHNKKNSRRNMVEILTIGIALGYAGYKIYSKSTSKKQIRESLLDELFTTIKEHNLKRSTHES